MDWPHVVLGGVTYRLEPYDGEELPVAASAVGLTLAKLAGATAVQLQFENGPLRWCVDGRPASATVGRPGYNLDRPPLLNDLEAKNLSMIRLGAVDALVYVTYYRVGGAA